jgi:hypothetical protein
MARLSAMFVVMMLAGAASADGLCYRQYYSGMQEESSRECRFSRLFESWLAANGFEAEMSGDHPLSVWQRVGGIGSSMGREFLPILPIRPAATVSLAYTVSKDETERMVALYDFRSGFFDSLDQKLRNEGKAILCETLGFDEEEFVAAGGVLTFEVGLRPGFIQSGYPDWLTRVKIDQSSCEAN